MSIKDDFLEEIQVGDGVAITYGESGALTVQGVVEKYLSSVVVVAGKRIRFDSIVDYEPLDPAQIKEQTHQTEQTVSRVPAAAAAPAERMIAPATPAPSGTELDCIAAAKELAAAPMLSEEALLELSSLRTKIKELRQEGKLSGNVIGVLDSLQNAAKQQDRSAMRYKLHDWKANTQKLLQQNQDLDAQDALYHLLAVIYVLDEDLIEAANQFGDAGRYDLAALCFQKLGDTDGVEECAALSILDNDPIPPYMLRLYAEAVRASKDVSALCSRMEEGTENPAEQAALLHCAAYLSAQAGLTIAWPDRVNLDSAENYRAFPKLLPKDWNTDLKHSHFLSLQEWQELPEPEEPDGQLSEEEDEEDPIREKKDVPVFVGTILHFSQDDTHFGWLRSDEKDQLFHRAGSTDRFFHINNVLQEDDNLLRQTLASNQYRGLEVEYILVDNGRPEPAAGDLRLTQRGYEEAKRRIERVERSLEQGKPAEPSEVRKGYIDEITDYYDKCIGRIDNKYTFRVDDVVDSELKAYLESIFEVPSQGIPVCYTCKKLPNGKVVAAQVRSADSPAPQEQEESRAQTDVQEQLEQLHRYDDNFYYRAIPIWDRPVSQKPAPAVIPPVKVVQPTPKPASVAVLPPLEPLPKIQVSKFADLPPYSSRETNGALYNRGANALKAGRNWREAEEWFIKSIRAQEMVELSVGNLVTLYLQHNEIMDALDLLDHYGLWVAPDKRVNHEIRIYEKATERCYKIKLCHIIETLLAETPQASNRFHLVSLQANTLRHLQEYSYALGYYQRWEEMYQTESQFQSSSVMAKYERSRPFLLRGKAHCLYMLGRLPEAKVLAEQLLRINSEDATARAILEENLERLNAVLDHPDAYFPDYAESMDEELEHSDLSEFVMDRLDKLDISTSTKNRYIEKGKYVGSISQAKKDVEFYIGNMTGRSALSRSEYLLAAAKISLEVNSRADVTKPPSALSVANAQKYAGRAMASYGDYLLSGMHNIDTARYAYLQALTLLSTRETDWNNAYHRFLRTYFYGIQELSESIREEINTGRSATQFGKILTNRAGSLVGSRENLTIGLLHLYHALEKKPTKRADLSRELFESPLRGPVLTCIREYLPYQVDSDLVLPDQFSNLLADAEAELFSRTQELIEAAQSCIANALSVRSCQESLSRIRQLSWQDCLVESDQARLKELLVLIEQFQLYHEADDFERKAECLNDAIRRINALTKQCDESPTPLTYDLLMPGLAQLGGLLVQEQQKHYEDVPQLSLKFKMAYPLTDKERVRVHVGVENKYGCQRADSLKCAPIQLAAGSECCNIAMDDNSLSGGESTEAIFELVVPEENIRQGSFQLTLQCSYRHTDAQQNSVLKEFSERMMVYLDTDSDLPSIVNVYNQYVGRVMTDAALFMGRDYDIETLLNMLHTGGQTLNRGCGVVLYGQTRAGKSSLTYHFLEKVKELWHHEIIIVNMGNLDAVLSNAMGDDNLAIYLSKFLRTLEGELQEFHTDVYAHLRTSGKLGSGYQILAKPEQAVALTDDYLSAVQRYCGRSKMILLVNDEFSQVHNYIQKGTMSDRFMFYLKAILQDYGIFAFLVGQDDMPQFIREYANAFASMKLMEVNYLPEEAAKKLIDQPISYTDKSGHPKSRYDSSALDELYRLTAGSAFLILHLCAKLVEFLMEKNAKRISGGIVREFLNSRVFAKDSCIRAEEAALFEPQINDRNNPSWESSNRALLTALAQASRGKGAKFDAIDCPYWSDEEKKRYLQRLLERRVVDRDSQGLYHVKVKLLEQWLLFELEGGMETR